MSKFITFGQAASRFAPLVTTGITIEDAIQEAVERIYEMGRYPGTVEEVEIVDSMISLEENEWKVVSFSDETYDGAVGFRNDERGFGIVDQVSLYSDGINSGDFEFLDLGVSEVEEDGEIVRYRRYRAPLNFDFNAGGPYYALMKLEPPELEMDDIIPVESIGALKCAILAVSYEYVADEDRSTYNWQKFAELMNRSSKQYHGKKKAYIGFSSSLRRKPKQFM